MNRFIILLASNSDAEKNMAEARSLLTRDFPEGILFSENHWSKAVESGGNTAPGSESLMYLNAVCRAQTERMLDDIQAFLKKTETELGRIRGIEAQGRVTMDMDLVEWNDVILRPKDAEQDYYKVCLRDL